MLIIMLFNFNLMHFLRFFSALKFIAVNNLLTVIQIDFTFLRIGIYKK